VRSIGGEQLPARCGVVQRQPPKCLGVGSRRAVRGSLVVSRILQPVGLCPLLPPTTT
jgi:hypothetical protein